MGKVSDVAGTDCYEQYTSASRWIVVRHLLGLDSPASIANTPSVASSFNLQAISYCCEPSFGLPQIARGGCRLLSRLLHSNARPITPHALDNASCSIDTASLSVSRLPSPPHVMTIHVRIVPRRLRAHVTGPLPHIALHPFCSSTYMSAKLGYLKSAFSSRKSIHDLRNLLPLTCTLAMARYVRGTCMSCYRACLARVSCVASHTTKQLAMPASHVIWVRDV